MNWQKIKYIADGLLRRRWQDRNCPSCGSSACNKVDYKGFHVLLQCSGCGLLYRWPYETREEMALFYQRNYQQAGLTTDLPDKTTLDGLLSNGFRDSEKDFSRIVGLLRVLALPIGTKLLDFGANWGYGVWQFRQAGLNAIGYELSAPRASYSKNLGVDVFTDWSDVEANGPFDVVFSSHVLEHTPDPAEALRQKLKVLSPGGLIISLFPNGSEVFQKSDPTAFHKLWGRVHPVLLNETFIQSVLPATALAIGSLCAGDLEKLRCWDRQTNWIGTVNTGEMLLVAAKPHNCA